MVKYKGEVRNCRPLDYHRNKSRPFNCLGLHAAIRWGYNRPSEFILSKFSIKINFLNLKLNNCVQITFFF